MFDIGFTELILIFMVGLFVIGPERLPSTVRTLALWIGRIRRSFSEMRQEIEQQIGAEDIRRELHNEQVLRNLERMKETHADLNQKINQWAQGETALPPADSAEDTDSKDRKSESEEHHAGSTTPKADKPSSSSTKPPGERPSDPPNS